jgi:hypothetical protein
MLIADKVPGLLMIGHGDGMLINSQVLSNSGIQSACLIEVINIQYYIWQLEKENRPDINFII